jgi:hypothetical protein
LVQTIRGPKVGTGKSSDHGSALMIARWWHTQQHTSSDRTPLARMLPSVMGSIGSLERVAAMARLYDTSSPSDRASRTTWGATRRSTLSVLPFFHCCGSVVSFLAAQSRAAGVSIVSPTIEPS